MNSKHTPSGETRPETYGAEVMCANWNPVAATMGKSIREPGQEWLADVAADDEAFLRQVYRSQRI